MIDGLIRVSAVAPVGAVASPEKTAQALARATRDAVADGARVIVFPEMALSSYAIGDLVTQTRLLTASEEALLLYCAATATLDALIFVGLPMMVDGQVYSCAACISRGHILGIVPKSHVGRKSPRGIKPYCGENRTIRCCGDDVTFGTKQLFRCATMPSLLIAAELGEDLASPVPPSCAHTAAGATLVVCLAAEPELVGAAARRRTLVAAHSARTTCAYIYAGAGYGESGTDAVYAAHEMVASLGKIKRECAPFGEGYVAADVDMDCVLHERTVCDGYVYDRPAGYSEAAFMLSMEVMTLTDPVEKLPFVPGTGEDPHARCELVLDIQARGLAGRIERAHAKTLVLGVSGGLDSTLAQLVAVRALSLLNRPACDLIAVTMPCFGTTSRTRSNAERLSEALESTFTVVNIQRAVEVHFADIGQDSEDHNTTYENAQARERTQVLMDLANRHDGMVVGTGDLSELALGWATYNGDHMSMYGVNAGVPKTLVRHLVAYEATRFGATGNEVAMEVLKDILATPVSPELLPPKDGEISQCTEGIVGPYELHDFFLYYIVRHGFSPRKVLRYAVHAFAEDYDAETIKRWLTVFVKRFFTQQFKRSCLPDGPAVGSVSLSPRGAWSMPSDALADAWLEELQ